MSSAVAKVLPQICLISCITSGCIVTQWVWIMHRFESLNRHTRYISSAFWRAKHVALCNFILKYLSSARVYCTNLWKGSFWMSRSVLCLYQCISHREKVSVLYLLGLFTSIFDFFFCLLYECVFMCHHEWMTRNEENSHCAVLILPSGWLVIWPLA